MSKGPRTQLSQQRRSRAFAEIETNPHVMEIAARLEKGQSYDAVAKWLTEEAKQFAGTSHRSLSKQLSRWWKANAGQVTEALAAYRNLAVKEIDDLEALVALQQTRIEQARNTEKGLPVLLKTLGGEINLQKSLLHLIIDKKQSLGLYAKTDAAGGPGTTINNTQNNNTQNNTIIVPVDSVSALAAKVLSDEKSRRKVLNTVRRLMAPQRTADEAMSARFKVGARSGGGVEVEPDEPASSH